VPHPGALVDQDATPPAQRRGWTRGGGVRGLALALGLVGLAAVPLAAALLREPFYIDLFRRVLIFALAAVSLDFILGYGGMVSFGHAAYLGVGAYVVGILAVHGVQSGFVQWPAAMLASLLVALVIGAVSLRTSGVYFIMITLAFAQMLYYLGISIEEYGGDDGMPLVSRSRFAGPIDLDNPYVFYYVVLGVLVLALALGHRLVNSRFGMVVRAARSNERRTEAIGFPTFRYRLTAFALAGSLCGLAGALLANQTEYLSPSFAHWTRSGEIMFMVILGGMGTLVGPVVGALVLLLLEDVLSGYTEHWQIVLGPFLVLVVLFAKRGLFGLLPEAGRRDA
jgi:branched-chain amino acid transport system permease protein